MKNIFYLSILLCLVYSCQSHLETQTSANKLSIASHIDQKDSLNRKIIVTLEKFLNTKDSSWTQNEYWEKSDFKKYGYPYIELNWTPSSYVPTLLEIADLDSVSQKLVKIAFISHSDTTNTNQLACIYNIIANIKDGKVVFSSYLNHSVKNWKVLHRGSILYIISPYKKINENEIEEQQKDIQRLCEFFKIKAVPSLYYSCCNPVELFQIRGFDYIPNMYRVKTGGIIFFGNHIFSGRNQEIYKHEIAHVHIMSRFPHIHTLLNEGMATFWGGSGLHEYAWHKENLKKYILEKSPLFQADQYFDTYNRTSAYKETQISYMVGALICERTLRLYGKDKLFELFNQKGELYEILSLTDLTKDNLNEELQKEAMLPAFKP